MKIIFFVLVMIVAISIISLTVFLTYTTEQPLTELPKPLNSNSIPLRIGTIGDSATKLIFRFQPTADYIAKHLSDEQTTYTGKVIIAETTEKMLTLLKNQELDLFVDSPFTTISMMDETGLKPSLVRWKDGSFSYYTVFLTKADSNINSIQDSLIKIWVFEDIESTSGYLLPLSHMSEKGLFSKFPNLGNQFVFSGDDENTAIWLIEGKGDIGAMSNLDYEDLPDPIKSQLKIIDETLDVPRHLVSYRSELEPELIEKISSLLLKMNDDSEGLDIMLNFKNTVNYTEFDSLEITKIIKLLNLIPVGVLK